jgi:energy-coupling factor transporter transmembrane protein EcfT
MLFRTGANNFMNGLNIFNGFSSSIDAAIGSFLTLVFVIIGLPSLGLFSVSAAFSFTYKAEFVRIILILCEFILVEFLLLVFFHYLTPVVAGWYSKKNAKVIEAFETRLQSYEKMSKEQMEQRLKEMK